MPVYARIGGAPAGITEGIQKLNPPLAIRMSNHGGEVGTASGVVVDATTRRTVGRWKAAAADPATTATPSIASAMRADGGSRRGEGAAIKLHRSPCTLG